MDQEQHLAPALAVCTEEERQQAMARFAVLRPHLHEDIPVSEAARDAGVPLRSVQRWLARYRVAGLVGLVRAKRSDTGKRKLPAALVALIEGMALRTPRPSIAAMHRTMTALATKRTWTPPSYGSVYGIVRRLSPAMVTLAQNGPAAFRDRYELIYRHRAACPNAIWQADHTLLDMMILDANGEAVRPWLTIIMKWLQVFGCTDATRRGSEVCQERQTSLVRSEKWLACWGSPQDGMCIIAACFVHALQRCTSRVLARFLFILHEVGKIDKTCNQLSLNTLYRGC